MQYLSWQQTVLQASYGFTIARIIFAWFGRLGERTILFGISPTQQLRISGLTESLSSSLVTLRCLPLQMLVVRPSFSTTPTKDPAA